MIQRRQLTAMAASIAQPSQAQLQAKSLRFVPHADLAVLDPVWSSAYVTRNHALLVYDTLYGMDDAYRIQPQMALGHETSADGLRWTVQLREGLRFHDGEPVLALDAVASIRRLALRDSLGQSLLASLDELNTPDDRTLQFRLKQPFPLLTYALGKPGSPICVVMPERLARTDAFAQITEVVGSGPFRFLPGERIPGARVAYARNAGYLPRPGAPATLTAGAKQAHLDRIEWLTMPDPATAAAALRRGEIDWWEAPTFDLMPSIAAQPTLRLASPDPLGLMGVLRFNHLHPPFDDPAVRRALLPAISPADYVTAAVGGYPNGGRADVGFFAPGTPSASEEGLVALTAPRDFARARRELEATGRAGARVVLIAPVDVPLLHTQAEIGTDLLRRLGFDVDVQTMDWGSALRRLARQDAPAQGGWNIVHTYFSGTDMMDPAVHPYLRGNGRQGRIGWPDSLAIETLRRAWLEAADGAARSAVAAALQRQAFQELPYVPIGQLRPRAAHRAGLIGVPPAMPTFWDVRWA